MTLSQCLIGSGLLLDIAGVILLFIFGLPSKIPQSGRLLLEGDYDEKGARRFRIGAYAGLTLLVLGFSLQFIGTVCR